MEGLQGPAFLFAVALLFSLLIERLLEIVKCVVDLPDSRFDWHRFWTGKAEKLAKKLEQQLRMNDPGDMKIFRVIIKKASNILLDEEAAMKTGSPVISGNEVRAFYLKIILKVAGVLFGLLIAYGLGLDIVNNWDMLIKKASYEPVWYGVLITGIMMGLGSVPMHKFIKVLERLQSTRQEKREEKS